MMDRIAFHARLNILGGSVRAFSTVLVQYVVNAVVFLTVAAVLCIVFVLRVAHWKQSEEFGVGCLGDSEERARSRLWRRVARKLLSGRIRRRLHEWFGDLWIIHRKDRAYLDRQLIPAVGCRGGKALFIGCRRYTKHYPALLAAHGVECWTIDNDPTVARWGAPGRHVIGDIQDALDHWPASSFDSIILNGVFGFGLNDVRNQDAALRVCGLLLAKGGCLILGWNTDRSVDPSDLSALRNYFKPSSFPGLAERQTFIKSTHVYDTFTAVEVE
jgi:SAM-dependent methyltransferase